MNTPENIKNRSDLPENAVFVFGSNLLGNHAGGAAKLAVEEFGAVMGVAIGIQGESWAFPTLSADMEQLPVDYLLAYASRLYQDCRNNSQKLYFLTRVGCGIAGYSEDFMKTFFVWNMSNLIKPKGW